jgi:hypothetical protein
MIFFAIYHPTSSSSFRLLFSVDDDDIPCVVNSLILFHILLPRAKLGDVKGGGVPEESPASAASVGVRHDRTVLLGMHPEEAEEPRGRRRREWNGGTRIGMYYRR